jgi:C1A family cysteine protease
MVFPTFAAWAATYGKVYNGDEVAREAVYNANVEWIKAHQHEAEGFTIGANQFADLTQEEFAAQYLTLKVDDKPAGVNMGTHEYSGADLPDEIDWSTKSAVSPVKDQGSCGSCWAFSTVGSLEGRAAIATGNLQQFSEQQFVDCDTDFGDQGCNGGLMDNAFKYLMQSKGACTEDSYGYKGKGGSCQIDSCTIGLEASKVTGFKDVAADTNALKEAVAEGPVSVAIQANSPFFQLYTGGVFKSNLCGKNLDHGVLTVGYGTDGGVDYWKVKNSWATSFGEQGYIRMIRGTKGTTGQCGILTGPPSYPVIASEVTV